MAVEDNICPGVGQPPISDCLEQLDEELCSALIPTYEDMLKKSPLQVFTRTYLRTKAVGEGELSALLILIGSVQAETSSVKGVVRGGLAPN